MAKSKGFYIERDTITEKIRKICKENWKEVSVSELYEVGNTNRCDFKVDGKTAMLNFFFKSDGSTTIQVTGQNIEIAQFIKGKLEENIKYSADTETRTCSFKKLPIEWADKLIGYFSDDENVTIQIREVLMQPKHKEYTLSSVYGDRLTINRYENGTLVLQGKPAYIYGEAITFLSYCNEITVNDLIENISNINRISVKTDDVHNELKNILKSAYDNIDPVIIKLLSPSIALRKISIDLDDYSCFAFPALRALEGYIKWILLQKGITVGKTFKDVFNKYNLTQSAALKIGDTKCQAEIERVFKFFKDNRHVHFHTEQILIGTSLIEKRSEADSIINSVLDLIDSSYKNIVI